MPITKSTKPYDRHALQYIPVYELGVASNSVNIKNSSGRFIGSVEAMEVPRFKAMEKGKTPTTFTPSSDWRLTFSIPLMDELGLSL